MNEDIGVDQVEPRWFIDLDWYQQNDRSFSALVRGCLCPECQDKLKGEVSVDTMLTTIKGCCSRAPDFISAALPILEGVFRIFLTNGNQPLALEELSRQLRERCGGDTHRTSVEVLSRLLQNERYYGLRQAQD